MTLNAIQTPEFSHLLGITQQVSTLRTRLHAWRAAWLRCSSLQGMTMPRRRALPDGEPDAHSNTFNCGFQDDIYNLRRTSTMFGNWLIRPRIRLS